MNIYTHVVDYLEKDKGGVVATIVKRIGATPQHAGAKIFIGDDSRIFGTVGGGCLEAEVWQESMRLMNTEKTKLMHFSMNGTSAEDEGMICGGSVVIYLEPVLKRYEGVYRGVLNCLRRGGRALIVTTFHEGGFRKSFVDKEGALLGDPIPEVIVTHISNYFSSKKPIFKDGVIIEPLSGAPHLIIFGTKEMAESITRLAKLIDFDVTFMKEDESMDAGDILEEMGVNEIFLFKESLNTYALFALKTKEDGKDRDITWIRIPMSLDIKAKTKKEIALAVVAELIRFRKG